MGYIENRLTLVAYHSAGNRTALSRMLKVLTPREREDVERYGHAWMVRRFSAMLVPAPVSCDGRGLLLTHIACDNVRLYSGCFGWDPRPAGYFGDMGYPVGLDSMLALVMFFHDGTAFERSYRKRGNQAWWDMPRDEMWTKINNYFMGRADVYSQYGLLPPLPDKRKKKKEVNSAN